jgi:hypothetical protein
MKYNAISIQQHQAARLLTQHYRVARENILGDGLKLCQRAKSHNSANPFTAYISVKLRDGIQVAKMHDVAHCGNAHLCAFCSGFKASNMRNWITEEFLPEVQNRGLVCGLLTLTAHHQRECDWNEFVRSFYRALDVFANTMRRNFKSVGSLGRVRAMECPVGGNGLHIHIHDLFTYAPSADIEALEIVALAKWKSALRKFGLHCSKKGVDIKPHGEFDAKYIAKELAAHNTKTSSKSDLVTLFKLLDRSARGDKSAGQDWVRAARAIQGRDRWNVGQLAHKLGIPCPSDWKRSQCISKNDSVPVQLIAYPQAHHMTATSPSSARAGLAFILRAARNEATRPGSVQRMALRMCDETIKADIQLIKQKHAYKLSQLITLRTTAIEQTRLAAKQFAHCAYAIAEYHAMTYSYMYPTYQTPAPAPTVSLMLSPDLELDFA